MSRAGTAVLTHAARAAMNQDALTFLMSPFVISVRQAASEAVGIPAASLKLRFAGFAATLLSGDDGIFC